MYVDTETGTLYVDTDGNEKRDLDTRSLTAIGNFFSNSPITSFSTLTSYSVTRSTEFFFSSMSPDARIASEPRRIRSPA